MLGSERPTPAVGQMFKRSIIGFPEAAVRHIVLHFVGQRAALRTKKPLTVTAPKAASMIRLLLSSY